MKKHLFAAALLAGAVTISAAQPSSALLPVVDEVVKKTTDTVDKTEGRVQAIVDTATINRQEVEAKRQAIEQKMAEKRAAVTEKLSGQREEKCKEKEKTINAMLDDRANAAQRHFNSFKAIENKLVAFVAEKQLNVANANAMSTIMNDASSSAESAVGALGNIDFTCEAASATAPGGIIKTQIVEAKEALKTYRTAIKEYASAVKAAVVSVDATETTTGATD